MEKKLRKFYCKGVENVIGSYAESLDYARLIGDSTLTEELVDGRKSELVRLIKYG